MYVQVCIGVRPVQSTLGNIVNGGEINWTRHLHSISHKMRAYLIYNNLTRLPQNTLLVSSVYLLDRPA